MLIIKATRRDPDQKQSELSLHCLARPFWQTTGARNFRARDNVHVVSACLCKQLDQIGPI